MMRIIAFDYGRAHTGVAICDPTGTIVRPMDDIDEAAGQTGLKSIQHLVEQETAAAIVVGLPVSLSGERGAQAAETQQFIELLSRSVSVPVISWDERFTSKMAAAKAGGSSASSHSIAACVLLEDFLGSQRYRDMQDETA